MNAAHRYKNGTICRPGGMNATPTGWCGNGDREPAADGMRVGPPWHRGGHCAAVTIDRQTAGIRGWRVVRIVFGMIF